MHSLLCQLANTSLVRLVFLNGFVPLLQLLISVQTNLPLNAAFHEGFIILECLLSSHLYLVSLHSALKIFSLEALLLASGVQTSAAK